MNAVTLALRAVMVAAVAVIAAGWLAIVFAVLADTDAQLLPPCATEDSNNCYWDADTMGNGIGTDSIVIEDKE